MLGGNGLSLTDVASYRAPKRTTSRCPSQAQSKFHLQPYETSVSMIIRYDYRSLFGVESYMKNGHFVDRNLTDLVYQYTTAVDYPAGDHTMKARSSVLCAVVSSDGRYLFTGVYSSYICRWDLTSGERIDRWNVYPGWTTCLDVSHTLLVSGGTNSDVILWDAYTNQELKRMKGHSDVIRSVRFGGWKNTNEDDGDRHVLSASDDRTVRMWSVKSGKCLRLLKGHTDWVCAAVFINDDDDGLALSGSEDRSLRLWDPSHSDESVHCYSVNNTVKDMAINCDASFVACVCRRKIVVYQWPEMFIIHRILEINYIRGLFHPTNQTLLAVADSVTLLKLFDLSTGLCIHTFKDHSKGIKDISFTPDGSHLISVSNEKRIHVWDLSHILGSLVE